MSSTSPAYRVARVATVLLAVLLASLPMLVDLPEEWAEPMADAPDGGTPEPGGFLTDGATDWPGVASLPMPSGPMPGQQTVCDPKRREVSINGGCYKEQAGKPPCAEGEFNHDGKCWAAVTKRTPPSTSVGQ